MAAGLLALPFGTAHAAETPVHDTSQAALAQSQLRDVTGRVTDRATGDPIVGVTVANNSTGSGTVTDAAGAFTVGVLWGFRNRKELEEGHADAIIAHPLELLKYCE